MELVRVVRGMASLWSSKLLCSEKKTKKMWKWYKGLNIEFSEGSRSWGECERGIPFNPLERECQSDTGLWLVPADHVTWKLASDWWRPTLDSRSHAVWPGPLVTGAASVKMSELHSRERERAMSVSLSMDNLLQCWCCCTEPGVWWLSLQPCSIAPCCLWDLWLEDPIMQSEMIAEWRYLMLITAWSHLNWCSKKAVSDQVCIIPLLARSGVRPDWCGPVPGGDLLMQIILRSTAQRSLSHNTQHILSIRGASDYSAGDVWQMFIVLKVETLCWTL